MVCLKCTRLDGNVRSKWLENGCQQASSEKKSIGEKRNGIKIEIARSFHLKIKIN